MKLRDERRTFLPVALLGVGVLALSIVAVGRPASARSVCPSFEPGTPEMTSEERAAKPLSMTARATEESPLTRLHEIPPTVIFWVTDTEVVDRSRYVNIQIARSVGAGYLHIRAEWPAPSGSEIDFYLRDESGERVAASQAINPAPGDAVESAVTSNDTGGDGWEGGIRNVPVAACDGFTLEIEPVHTLGEEVTSKLWLTRKRSRS